MVMLSDLPFAPGWIVLAVAIVGALGVLALVASEVLREDRAGRDDDTPGHRIKVLKSELTQVRSAIDSHAIVSQTDRRGRIIYVNDKFVEVSGYARDELIGQTHAILKSGDTTPEFYAEMWRTIRSGGIWTGEIKNRRKDGSPYWVQSTIMPHVGSDGRHDGYISFRTDVTWARTRHAARQWARFLDLIEGEVYVLDPADLTVLSINRAAHKALGRPDDDVAGQPFAALVPGADTPEWRAGLKGLAVRRGGVQAFEITRRNHDGTDEVFSVRVRFVEPDGLPDCLVVTVRDVSGRRAAERRVRDVSSTLDQFPARILMVWPDTHEIFYANQSAVTHYGLDAANLGRARLADIENGAFDDAEMLNAMIAGERTSHRFVLRDGCIEKGTLRAVECNVYYVAGDADEAARFMIASRDVTEQETASESVAQLTEALDRITDDIFAFDADTFEFIYLNRAARQRTGLSKDAARGKVTSDYFLPGKHRQIEEACAALRSGDLNQTVFECTDRNGKPIEVHLHHVRPMGRSARFVAIFHDISERKAAEQAKANFISTVSHELRTPLTAIKGSLDLVSGQKLGPLTDMQARFMDNARRNAGRLGRLINEILDIDKIESGTLQMDLREVDLSEVLRDAIEANRPYAAKYNVDFWLFGADHPIPVLGDRDRLAQVMDNLLSNAAKFSNEGDLVEVSVAEIDGHVRISVRDQGVGIPAEAQATIFDRFTQADAGDARRRNGTGLGLSIAKAIVDLHGGRISFTSGENAGTTFHVDLRPADRPQNGGETEEAA